MISSFSAIHRNNNKNSFSFIVFLSARPAPHVSHDLWISNDHGVLLAQLNTSVAGTLVIISTFYYFSCFCFCSLKCFSLLH
jgi:hypothetical protein